MTISLTVIIIECTGDVTFGIPIMISLIIAKWMGDYFNPVRHGILQTIHVLETNDVIVTTPVLVFFCKYMFHDLRTRACTSHNLMEPLNCFRVSMTFTLKLWEFRC